MIKFKKNLFSINVSFLNARKAFSNNEKIELHCISPAVVAAAALAAAAVVAPPAVVAAASTAFATAAGTP